MMCLLRDNIRLYIFNMKKPDARKYHKYLLSTTPQNMDMDLDKQHSYTVTTSTLSIHKLTK